MLRRLGYEALGLRRGLVRLPMLSCHLHGFSPGLAWAGEDAQEPGPRVLCCAKGWGGSDLEWGTSSASPIALSWAGPALLPVPTGGRPGKAHCLYRRLTSDPWTGRWNPGMSLLPQREAMEDHRHSL